MTECDFLIPWDKKSVKVYNTEILILGSGIAGLFTAAKLSDKYHITILTKKNIMESNTEHAQGGIAVALNKEDSPEFHYGDTIMAGAGLCNINAVKVLSEKGPDCVKELIALGTQFDRSKDKLDFTREGAHSKRRVLRAKGDATGGEIERALVETVRLRSIQVKENYYVIDFLKTNFDAVAGVLVLNKEKEQIEVWLAKVVILATGGLGQLYKYTTNPGVATGDGIAAAYRAGAELMDMEFIQFHPTALHVPGAPCFLISEAARGEGAILLNSQGYRFMEKIPGQELAPRDVVARAIWEQMQSGLVYLDFSSIKSQRVQERFPKIYKTCLQYGIDLSTTPVPIGPAAHYLMGGVRVNTWGETSLANLYACGECGCNGVHGANRLASNSLLDGLVFARTITEKLNIELGGLSKWEDIRLPEFSSKKTHNYSADDIRAELREIMWEKAGIIRNAEGLSEAAARIKSFQGQFIPELDVPQLELGNMLTLGQIIVRSSLERRESRGGHYRSDFPFSVGSWKKHSVYKRGDTNVSYVSI